MRHNPLATSCGHSAFRHRVLGFLVCAVLALGSAATRADSVNSPNIMMNVDTNRAVGAGAGDVAVVVNTITISETMLTEYSAGATSVITISVRPGYQFNPASNITAQSATIGINGGAINAVATIVPSGAANETLTFALTSGTSAGQDIIRINGIQLKIISAAGAVGPAQTTLSLSTTAVGGAFADQGIVAANIVKGAADHLEFTAQPGSTQSNADLLPAVKMVDFGGNLITNDPRAITLAIQTNPGAATLQGLAQRTTVAGVATWVDADDLRIATASVGYTLRASHDGAAFLSSDVVDSGAFDITAGAPNHLLISLQPSNTVAGDAINISVTVLDAVNNIVLAPSTNISIDSAIGSGNWPLLVDTSLTKATANGVASWNQADNLRINKAVTGYRLLASGVGAPAISGLFDITPASPNTLNFVQQPTQTQENDVIATPVTVEILDAFANRTTSTAAVTLSLQSSCGGAISGAAVNAIGGLATFSALSVDTPCASVMLDASSVGLQGATSNAFTVTPLPPAALRFLQQPTAAEPGAAFDPPVSVEIVDAEGKTVDGAAIVNLTLLSSCGGALSVTSAVAINSPAIFDNLSVDTPCAGIVLEASADGFTSATSDAFDVTEPVVEAPMDMSLCGACGFGVTMAMSPLLLMLIGMKARIARRRCAPPLPRILKSTDR